MASIAAARSALRSSSARISAAKFACGAAAAATATKPRPSSPFGLPKQARLPPAPRILRSPVELSFCVESLLPMHSVTASALMTSLLSVSRGGYGWLAEGKDDTR